jgi:hypothetical protein
MVLFQVFTWMDWKPYLMNIARNLTFAGTALRPLLRNYRSRMPTDQHVSPDGFGEILMAAGIVRPLHRSALGQAGPQGKVSGDYDVVASSGKRVCVELAV